MFCSFYAGVCLIINNEKFGSIPENRKSKLMPERKGTQVDCGE